MADEMKEKRLTSAEKLDAAKKLLEFLEKEVPETDQIEVTALMLKSIKGNFVVKYGEGII